MEAETVGGQGMSCEALVCDGGISVALEVQDEKGSEV